MNDVADGAQVQFSGDRCLGLRFTFHVDKMQNPAGFLKITRIATHGRAAPSLKQKLEIQAQACDFPEPLDRHAYAGLLRRKLALVSAPSDARTSDGATYFVGTEQQKI